MRSSDSSRCALGASVRCDMVSKALGMGSHTLLPAPLNNLLSGLLTLISQLRQGSHG